MRLFLFFGMQLLFMAFVFDFTTVCDKFSATAHAEHVVNKDIAMLFSKCIQLRCAVLHVRGRGKKLMIFEASRIECQCLLVKLEFYSCILW